MRKIIFREMRVQGTWLSGSKSHCSISRTERVLLVDEKKKKHPKIGAIFKKNWEVTQKVIEVILSIATLIEFALLLLNLPIW
jgi:hypothetical protein